MFSKYPEINNYDQSLNVKAIKTEKYFHKNYSYLVMNPINNFGVIIDPSWESAKIDKEINDNKIVVSDVLLTHSHFDHTHLASYYAERYNCNVWMSADEINYYNFKCKNLKSFHNNETLSLGDIFIKPIITPGHTAGSTCYLIGNNLFSGDTLFIEGCGICLGQGADPHKMFESIILLKHIVSPGVLVFPGHSYGKQPGKSFREILNNNIYLQIDTEKKFVDFRMRKNQKGLFNFF